MTIAPRLALALAALGPLACEAAPPTTPTSSPAPAATPPTAPRTAPTATTADDRLGTRPEGFGLAPGAPMPMVTIADIDGRAVDLKGLADKGPLLLVFYRGGWCPFCNTQLRGLATASAEFQQRGVTPVAVSVDRPDEATKTKAAWSIPFPVLADPDLVAHGAFQVGRVVPDDEVAMLKGKGLDLERASGKTHHTIAVPAVFFVEGGVVRWSHVDLDYKTRPSVPQLLAAIDRVRAAPKP